ncbi:hypothetical protein AQJ46_45235 [Streptomyces canus]|uniref:Pentapeptide repeat-containing protein n=1 Tax=Streptomyces canus TaxID=58343 RepID=A0A101RLT5_9ACTN|nr:hypothetical protein AQJ46_45235 [Streptomyces canus]
MRDSGNFLQAALACLHDPYVAAFLQRRQAPHGRYTPNLWSVWLVALLALSVVGVLSFGLYHGIYHLFADAAHNQTPRKLVDINDVIKTTVTVLTLTGAVLAGIYAYRKQLLAEGDAHRADASQLADRYTTASEQLGHERAAVRLAGVYALARLADDWQEQRQVCVDVLCAYLRMPYEANPTAAGHKEGEREVRHTIIRVIRDHLQQPEERTSWTDCDLDFTGAVFDGGDFSGSHFRSRVVFTGATFGSGRVAFKAATFSGAIDFKGATFNGAKVDFGDATFSGGGVYFGGAMFSDGQVHFLGATFSDGQVHFGLAEFSGATVDFSLAAFSGGKVNFSGATVSNGVVGFRHVAFSGARVTFSRAAFSGGTINFSRAAFSGGTVSFKGAAFSGARATFRRAVFSSGTVDIGSAEFSGGAVIFTDARLLGGTVDFANTTFNGTAVSWGPVPHPPDA